MIAPTSSLRFKADRLRKEWDSDSLHDDLRYLANKLAILRLQLFGVMTTVNSIYRTPEEDKALGGSGPHSDWRAIDLHLEAAKLEGEDAVRRAFNTDWPTGLEPKMPRIPPLNHGTGPHFHIQITRDEKANGIEKLRSIFGAAKI